MIASRLAIALALAWPSIAHSQDEAHDNAGPVDEQDSVRSDSKIQDIVVTARRREEQLQDVPLSVTAVTGETLERTGITDTRQLTQTMPSLVFTRINTNFQPYIRGVGTRNAAPGDESAVAVYIDGVYQPQMPSLGFDLLAIERVETLRGPQGTLFGRNSTGGLINIITPDPKFTPSGRLTLRAGSFGERSVQFYGTGGITDTLAIDIAALHAADDGYIRNLVRGSQVIDGTYGGFVGDQGDYVGDKRAYAVRSKILFEPSERFRATLALFYSHLRDSAGLQVQPINSNTQGRRPPVPPVIAVEPWTTALDRPKQGGAEVKQADLQTAYEFDWATLETTSSIQKVFAFSLTDIDATTKDIGRSHSFNSSKFMTNELRLLSAGNGPLEWIAGVYLLNGEGGSDPLHSFTNGNLLRTSWTNQDVDSWAVFAEGTYTITGPLRLTLGLRYTEETRTYNARAENAAGLTISSVSDRRASFEKLTYRASLQYLLDDANFYLTYSRGFKSGLFNGFAIDSAAAQPVQPETLDSIELGMKIDPAPWIQLNAAVFYYDYKDIQQSARDPVTALSVLTNAAAARTYGGEAEIIVVPVSGLNLRGYATYLDAKFTSFPFADIFVPATSNGVPIGGNVLVSPFDAAGRDLIRAPRYTFGASMNYEKETEHGTFGAAFNVFHTAKFYWEFANRLIQPAYTTVNGELSWAPDDDVRLSLWGRNLTDAVIYQQMASGAQADTGGFERPRSYGVSATFNF